MEGFREAFAAYGADYQETMGRFMGNEGMYLRLMDMLFKDDSVEKLGQALAAGDLTGAFEAAHTLKGVAANMGLTPLYRVVCCMVDPLRAQEVREDYLEQYQAVQEELRRADRFRRQLKGELV